MTFGVYLTARWLPGKRLVLADSTYDGYRRSVERHALPTLGGVALRRLRPAHLENLYERLLHPRDGTAGVPVIRLDDLRHTPGTLLIKAGVPVKVVSERLGHATPAFTIDTYQHVLPGMQADAARVFEQLVVSALPPAPTSREKTRLKRREKTA